MYKKCPAVYNVLTFFYKFHSLTADSDVQVGLGIPSSFTKPSLSGHFLYTGRWRQALQNRFRHRMRKEIKISGSYILDNGESSFLGTIVFEERNNSIYYSWKISDKGGQGIGSRSMNVDFRQIPVGQDKYIFVENHALQNIRGLRIGREKVIKEVSVHGSASRQQNV